MHDVLRALALLNLLLPILPVLQVLTAVQQLSDDRGAGGRGEALGFESFCLPLASRSFVFVKIAILDVRNMCGTRCAEHDTCSEPLEPRSLSTKLFNT